MSSVVTLVCIAVLAAFVYHYLPPDRPRRLFHLEQFRPAAPLAGMFDEEERPDTPAAHPVAAPEPAPVQLSETGPTDEFADRVGDADSA